MQKSSYYAIVILNNNEKKVLEGFYDIDFLVSDYPNAKRYKLLKRKGKEASDVVFEYDSSNLPC
jgi:hypothetical protein